MASQPHSSIPPESFSIISTLRYDPQIPAVASKSHADIYPYPKDSPYYLLPFHRDRLLNAATHFNWAKAIEFLQLDTTQFSQLLDKSISDQSKPWRLRIAVDSQGNCTVDVNPAAPCSPRSLFIPSADIETEAATQLPPWKLYLDTQPTEPSAFTTHKTTVRDEYTSARERVGITSLLDPVEVLVFNPQEEVMEGSITTPYFRRRSHIVDTAGSGSGSGEDGFIWVTPPLSSGGNAGTTRRYALEKGFCVERLVKVDELVDGEECWLSNGVRGFIRAVVVLER
ncbi:putative secondary metabolism biosynthetic enzyme [Paecilomyces lecythidis]|uniref:Secondary metabolism biosynthetic enzyme n=1 Tax=Paecilomyces lecythidis TaxID=3004212 RepID=A0ABR3X6Z1_9EURO